MKRGELYWARLVPRSGSEQQGRRPVVVVSSDGFNDVPTWRSKVEARIGALSREVMERVELGIAAACDLRL